MFFIIFSKIKNELNLNRCFEITTPLFNYLENSELINEFHNLPPSTQFALELMLLNIDGQLNKKITIESSKLFMEEESFINENIKFKVREDEIYNDTIILNSLLKNNKIIRIDGNNTFNAQTMENLIKSSKISQIEYIEDSFITIQEELKFNKRFPNVALGRDLNNIKINIENHIEFYILKPILLGGVSSLVTKIIDLEANGKKGCTEQLFRG